MCVSKCGVDEHRAGVNPIQSDWYSIERYQFVRSVNDHGVMMLEVLLAAANGMRSASAASANQTMSGGVPKCLCLYVPPADPVCECCGTSSEVITLEN